MPELKFDHQQALWAGSNSIKIEIAYRTMESEKKICETIGEAIARCAEILGLEEKYDHLAEITNAAMDHLDVGLPFGDGTYLDAVSPRAYPHLAGVRAEVQGFTHRWEILNVGISAELVSPEGMRLSLPQEHYGKVKLIIGEPA